MSTFDRAVAKPEAWTAVTWQNSWTDYAGFQSVQYRKVGDMVQVRGVGAPGTTTSGTTVFTLPTGYRPPATVMTAQASGSGVFGRVDFQANGAVRFFNGSAATFMSFHAEFSLTT